VTIGQVAKAAGGVNEMSDLGYYRGRIGALKLVHQTAKQVAKQAKTECLQADENYENAAESQRILQHVAQAVQQHAHSRIASVVSRCLESIFEENAYKFKIEFERKRGRTEARLVFVRDGSEIDPMEASGGGAVDVAAFALRIACLMLSRPQLRRLVVCDEPFRFVSVNYRQRIRALLENLSKEMGIQFVVVTHMEDLRMGTVIDLGK